MKYSRNWTIVEQDPLDDWPQQIAKLDCRSSISAHDIPTGILTIHVCFTNRVSAAYINKRLRKSQYLYQSYLCYNKLATLIKNHYPYSYVEFGNPPNYCSCKNKLEIKDLNTIKK